MKKFISKNLALIFILFFTIFCSCNNQRSENKTKFNSTVTGSGEVEEPGLVVLDIPDDCDFGGNDPKIKFSISGANKPVINIKAKCANQNNQSDICEIYNFLIRHGIEEQGMMKCNHYLEPYNISEFCCLDKHLNCNRICMELCN